MGIKLYYHHISPASKYLSEHFPRCNAPWCPYLHTALGEAEPLLDHSGQLSDPTALLSQNVLGPENKFKKNPSLILIRYQHWNDTFECQEK